MNINCLVQKNEYKLLGSKEWIEIDWFKMSWKLAFHVGYPERSGDVNTKTIDRGSSQKPVLSKAALSVPSFLDIFLFVLSASSSNLFSSTNLCRATGQPGPQSCAGSQIWRHFPLEIFLIRCIIINATTGVATITGRAPPRAYAQVG